MKSAWVRKEHRAVPEGPLPAHALRRLQAMSADTLIDWIDGSLGKVGKLVHDSARPGRPAKEALLDAEQEAAAVLQAVRELLARSD